MAAEHDRLADQSAAWKQWGPYLSERAWGTVREDYSADGDAWDYLPFSHAHQRAYRWNEDGLGGICDIDQYMCFALGLWNGRDPILKERLFGLAGPQGNHGEDVKECYFYLDSTPTHSYMRMLYKYPQARFPYEDLLETNRDRSRQDPEYELLDTGIFDDQRYFDVAIEYAKVGPTDILIRVAATNRGPEPARLVLLPTLWYRNRWDWGRDTIRPAIAVEANAPIPTIRAQHHLLGSYLLYAEGADELLFTDNATNLQACFGAANTSPHTKDAFNRAVIDGESGATNPARTGTKAAARYDRTLQPGETLTLRLRLTAQAEEPPFERADRMFESRLREADEFYDALQPASMAPDLKSIQRQALAGMLWSKQFYHYDINHWLQGDPNQPTPPAQRLAGRNHDWMHLSNNQVLSMPDAWEYPWFAAWDLAFHTISLALVDVAFAKRQIETLVWATYQHPNGQIPAYEWAFGDVNPPVLAWAALRVYQLEQKYQGTGDRAFLERIFHKMLLNFTWWVNRKDSEGNNVFQGGFLGLDNIGVFDRSAPLPTGGTIEQSDGTSWMGMFSLDMLNIALLLAEQNHVYEDIATKFFEHFLYIAGAMSNIGDGINLWDAEDEFFYDVLRLPNGSYLPLKVRSLVGLIPLFATTTIEAAQLDALPDFRDRLERFLAYRPDLAGLISRWAEPGAGDRRQLALVRGHRLKRLLKRALDPQEFLSDYGIRSLSKYHQEHPYTLDVEGTTYTVSYEPAESRSGTFGGNSNWRGPIWFPVNYLLIEALQRFHHYYSDDFLVECPTGSGQMMTLKGIADHLSQRLVGLFCRDAQGTRPFNGPHPLLQRDPQWRDYILFYEYFNGDSGAGVGASHQTGWTGLVAKLIQQQAEQLDTAVPPA